MKKVKGQKNNKKAPKKPSKTTRVRSLCTDNGREYQRLRSTAIKRAYKVMQAGRFTKEAIAQFIADAEFTTNHKSATLHTFHIPYSSLTKKEKKVAKYAYEIAESNYLSRLHKLVITDDKAHSALKVVAEIKGMIKKEVPTPPTSPNAGLRITVTDESGNQIPDKYKDRAKDKKEDIKPLTLNEDQTAEVTH